MELLAAPFFTYQDSLNSLVSRLITGTHWGRGGGGLDSSEMSFKFEHIVHRQWHVNSIREEFITNEGDQIF